MRRNILGEVFVLTVLAARPALCAAPLADPVPVARAETIARDMTTALHRFDVPGAVVMVVRNGKPSLVQTFGERDAARNLPVRRDTHFEIGSITKQFTAACILQLQEAGKLRLDRPLADYLPDAPHAKEVTLRQLLTHTSGLHDYFDETLAGRPISYSNLIGRGAALPLDFPPGSRWSYSNTNYLLLGKVIEAVSGESYGAYLTRHILGPLHMTETYTTADEAHLPDMALGYRHVDGKRVHAPITDPGWAGAAGFLVTTLDDLAKWDTALSGGKVVSLSDYRQMATAFMTTKNGSANYGLGLFVDTAYGQPRIGHTGGSLGFTTADEYFPRQGVRIVAFTNLADDTPEAGETLTNIVFADLYPALAAAAATPSPGEDAAVTQTMRDAFRALQTGRGYARFAAHLRGKLEGGAGAGFVSGLGPYGAPSGQIFKGRRREANASWYAYVLQFGPGAFMPFAVKLGPDGAVSGISVG
ncbi:MAG TPA: serine hydrolase domain-containing protein [Rhizomicrobium sp.]|jgi:CubicO group peptidase (beta-lactamase class C family)